MRLLFLIAAFCVCMNGNAQDYLITDFEALADTTVVSTAAIQNAIDKCSEHGGGRVIVPPGDFLTGTLILKSNVTLYLAKGATLYGSRNILDYAQIKPGYVALRTKVETRQLIYAENACNISICGEGYIDGQGKYFPQVAGNEGITRPHLIQMVNCRKVNIANISLQNSGAWMQHYLACEELKINRITVFNHANKNNDGIDIDGCKNVTISDVIVDSDDDGICLKSTSAAGCENVTITNCIVSSHCNALKMGTETNTGFKNISITNVIVKPSQISDRTIYGAAKGISGIALEIVDGGTMDGVIINNIRIEGTRSPLFIRLGNRARPYRDNQVIEHVGRLQNVLISNVLITTDSELGCSITGLPGYPVEHIKLHNVHIETGGNGTLQDTDQEIPEHEKRYPEATMFGKLPASGFFVRHARNICLSGLTFRTMNPDLRPALFLEDVHNADIQNNTIFSQTGNRGNLMIKNCENILLHGNCVQGSSTRFMELLGKNHRIILQHNILDMVDDVYPRANAKGVVIDVGNIK